MEIAPLAFANRRQNSNNNANMFSFGYSFFLKGIPRVPCSYCSRPTLSIPEIDHLAQTLENSSAKYALPIFQKIYNYLDNTHKVIIDILKTKIEDNPKSKLRETLVDLSDKFEDLTNQRYSDAINNSLKKSQIKNGTMLF